MKLFLIFIIFSTIKTGIIVDNKKKEYDIMFQYTPNSIEFSQTKSYLIIPKEQTAFWLMMYDITQEGLLEKDSEFIDTISIPQTLMYYDQSSDVLWIYYIGIKETISERYRLEKYDITSGSFSKIEGSSGINAVRNSQFFSPCVKGNNFFILENKNNVNNSNILVYDVSNGNLNNKNLNLNVLSDTIALDGIYDNLNCNDDTYLIAGSSDKSEDNSSIAFIQFSNLANVNEYTLYEEGSVKSTFVVDNYVFIGMAKIGPSKKFIIIFDKTDFTIKKKIETFESPIQTFLLKNNQIIHGFSKDGKVAKIRKSDLEFYETVELKVQNGPGISGEVIEEIYFSGTEYILFTFDQKIILNSLKISVCPLMTRSKDTKSLECLTCSNGYFAENYDQPFCSICDLGKYRDETNGICVNCPAGTYTSDIIVLESACTNCPAGTYSEEAGIPTFEQCNLCPKNTVNPKYGSNTVDDCVACSEDQVCLEGSSVKFKEIRCFSAEYYA